MKDIEEIIETTNEYLRSEGIPEEWCTTELGGHFRRDLNSGQVVAMSEDDMRVYYKRYVAEWADDDETLEEEEVIEHIDFMAKKRDLHEEIYDAIVYLMEKHGKEELDISDENDGDLGYACISWDSCDGVAIEEKQVEKVRVDGRSNLSLRFVDDGHWYGAAVADDEVLWCTINSVYDAVYDRLVRKGGES